MLVLVSYLKLRVEVAMLAPVSYLKLEIAGCHAVVEKLPVLLANSKQAIFQWALVRVGSG